jgi:DNA polymerase-3 subunit gamma/tau
VIEIDGASNRGIDDIRQINETVGYAPSQGRYKIYIIDEVHMLTKEAFNALLKTLEEPPEQAKFFFATTEPHKFLPTIISRCQRFDLARIQPNLISSKLQQIAVDLSRDVDPEALQLIAAFSEGSLRDAESLFDQILCFSEKQITASIVRQTLGLVPEELFQSLDQAFSAYHLPYAFEIVDQLFQTGKDLAHFLEQLIEHYRNIVNAKCKQAESAKLYTMQQALHILDLLIQAESTFQKSAFQRISLESILLQIIRSKHRIPVEVLVKHLTSTNAERGLLSAEREEKPVVSVAAKAETEAPPKPSQIEPETPKVEIAEVPKPDLIAPPAPIVEKKPIPAEIVEAPKPVPAAPLELKAVPAPVAPPVPLVEKKPIPTEVLETPKPISVAPLELKTVPFNPYVAKKEEIKPAVKEEKKLMPHASVPVVEKKPQSHYDTVMRFAAVEFEGTIKN